MCPAALLMPGRYLKGVWKLFGHLKVVCWVSERSRKVSGGCLEVSGCIVDAGKVSDRCLEAIWLSESCQQCI